MLHTKFSAPTSSTADKGFQRGQYSYKVPATIYSKSYLLDFRIFTWQRKLEEHFNSTRVPYYIVSKFSQDLESLLAPIFSIRIRALSFVGVMHPASRSVIRKLDVFLFLVIPARTPGLAGFRPRRLRSGLRRICFSVPTNRSSTLWFNMADTSMYFVSNDSADNRPSVR